MFEQVKRWLAGTGRDDGREAQSLICPDLRLQNAASAYHAGLEAFQAGQLDSAAQYFQRAVAAKHDLAEAHFYLGLIHRKRSELEEAADSLLLAVTFKPDLAVGWLYLGAVAHERKQPQEARANFKMALRVRPNWAEAHNGLGKVDEEAELFHEAAMHYRQAIEFDPKFAPAYSNLAYVTLRGSLDADAALGYAQRAVELQPDLADAHKNIAQVLQFKGRCEEAIEACNIALRLDPGADNARVIRAFAQLMLGRFEQGWCDYEARKQVYPVYRARKLPYAEWDGSPLQGKALLVYHEQGLGDEIMFASCFPDVQALGARCVIECSGRLERLFGRSFPAARVVVADQTSPNLAHLASVPPCDWQIASGSLPRFLRRGWKDFPQHHGYLVADAARVEFWRTRLRALGPAPRIGLSWRGGHYQTNQTNRSIELEQLSPLLQISGAKFVSLQYTDCREELARLHERHGVVVNHWQEAIDDYDETAALVSALDLVVSVDNATVNLAGALGQRCWVLLSHAPEWRYGWRGETMPWYPSVKLFRQTHPGDWMPVIESVAAELGCIERR